MSRVFILGSGFSAQLSGGLFPTSQQLLAKLKDEVKTPNLHRNILEIPSGDSIQNILTRIDLDNHMSDEDRKALKHDIMMCFQQQLSLNRLYNENWDVKKAKKLVKDLFQPGDVILNFNWDILLEHLICLNGDCFDYGAIFSNQLGRGGDEPEFITAIIKDNGEKRELEEKVTILKPHGAFNFIEFREGSLMPILYDHHKKKVSFFVCPSHKHLFPGIQLENPPSEKLEGKPLFVVLPSHYRRIERTEELQTWFLADDAMTQATEVIVIGYSFPPEDAFTWSLLNLGLKKETVKNLHILGNVDETSGGELSLRRRIQRWGFVGTDDKETADKMEKSNITPFTKYY